MAEITKPIALDETFNTTEGTSRNIADVLAQGIGDLVTVVSRISHQTTYDELSDLEDVNISAPTNGDVLTYDGSKWTNGQGGGGASVEQMIAPVEASTTASQAYAIGEQFILNGTLYTATAAITAGGTITIGGNCTASDSVTEQIEDVAKNLSYKIVASGTTIAQLKTALAALSYDDYLKSYLQIVDNESNPGAYILKPIDFRIEIKQYAAYAIPFNASYASKTWNLLYNQTANTIDYTCRTQPINSGYTQTTPAMTNWNLFVLQ